MTNDYNSCDTFNNALEMHDFNILFTEPNFNLITFIIKQKHLSLFHHKGRLCICENFIPYSTRTKISITTHVLITLFFLNKFYFPQ